MSLESSIGHKPEPERITLRKTSAMGKKGSGDSRNPGSRQAREAGGGNDRRASTLGITSISKAGSGKSCDSRWVPRWIICITLCIAVNSCTKSSLATQLAWDWLSYSQGQLNGTLNLLKEADPWCESLELLIPQSLLQDNN